MKEKKKEKSLKKKEKKKKHRGRSSNSSADEEAVWVVKGEEVKLAPVVKGPQLQRDSWMTEPTDAASLLPLVSREQLRAKKREEEEKSREEKRLLEEPGKHARELNPYWKDGGTGMPEEKPSTVSSTEGLTGDGGVAWWKKAYQRCVEAAKEEGRSLKDVAADRYGSLEKLESMLMEAERNVQKQSENKWKKEAHTVDNISRKRHRSCSRSPQRRDSGRTAVRASAYQDSDRRDRSSHKSRSPFTYRGRQQDTERSSYHRGSSPRHKSYSSRFKKPDSDGDEDYHQHRKPQSKMFTKPCDSDSENDYHSRHKPRTSRSKRSSSNSGDERDTRRGQYDHRHDNRLYKRKTTSSSGWRKKGFEKPRKDSSDSDRSRSPKRSHTQSRSSRYTSADSNSRKDLGKPSPGSSDSDSSMSCSGSDRRRIRSNAASGSKHLSREATGSRGKIRTSSSESDSDSSSCERNYEDKRHHVNQKTASVTLSSEQQPLSPPPRMLTELEMNQLGAKILKAEIMGNKNEASKLKTELEAARALKSAPSSHSSGNVEPSEAADDNVVLLTRTDRAGNVIPVMGGGEDRQQGSRKKKKAKTHTAGDRDRYFADDDKFDLQTLVRQEKLGTAEDQNMLFAKLAGKGKEKTDEDWQIDDVMVKRAGTSDQHADQRHKAQAIMEHKTRNKAMKNCRYCFANIPKHLIIAIGSKSYLSLPGHRSLSTGHCLIIPMTHTTQATVLDEEVWAEIQEFRKSLTRLFESRDEDCVFMETCRNVKSMPHMAIECIPMPREVGDLAPIYFKKALQEAGPEWAQNKKLVDLKNRSVRSAIPKGFPYFCVNFAMDGGYAHVIEDDKTFPTYFGREIVGGMLEAEPTLWRKPAQEKFEEQSTKVLEFTKLWEPFDWTSKNPITNS